MKSVALQECRTLGQFKEAFETPDFRPGEFVYPPAVDGVFQIPYAEYATVVDEFVRAAYKGGWVQDFDWPSWAQTDEARQLRDDEVTLSRASVDHLRKLLTVCLRQERFCEGALLDAFKSGLILRIVKGASVLAEGETLIKV